MSNQEILDRLHRIINYTVGQDRFDALCKLGEDIQKAIDSVKPNKTDWTQSPSLTRVIHNLKADLESAKESLGGPAARHRIEQCQKDVDVILEKLQIAQVADDKRERYKDRLLQAALSLFESDSVSMTQATQLAGDMLADVEAYTEKKFNGT